MNIPDSTIKEIKKAAEGIEHGEIKIKLNDTRGIIDVSNTNVKRTYLKMDPKPKSDVKPGGMREG